MEGGIMNLIKQLQEVYVDYVADTTGNKKVVKKATKKKTKSKSERGRNGS